MEKQRAKRSGIFYRRNRIELKFIIQVLGTMNIEVKLPITVHVDNVIAIFMATNQTSSDRTKHVDGRYHFVREFIEDGVVKIKFVRFKENDADLCTKNVNGELYNKHSQKLFGRRVQ